MRLMYGAGLAGYVAINLDLHRKRCIGTRASDPLTERLAGGRSIRIRQRQFVQDEYSISLSLADDRAERIDIEIQRPEQRQVRVVA